MILKWYKVKTKYANGPTDWHIKNVYVGNNQDIDYLKNEIVMHINHDHNWSDKYRGCDFEWIEPEDVPQKIIQKEMEYVDIEIQTLMEKKELLTKQLV